MRKIFLGTGTGQPTLNPTMKAAIRNVTVVPVLAPMKPERLYSLYRTGVKLSPAEIAAARAWAEEHGMWWPEQTA